MNFDEDVFSAVFQKPGGGTFTLALHQAGERLTEWYTRRQKRLWVLKKSVIPNVLLTATMMPSSFALTSAKWKLAQRVFSVG